MNFYIRKIFKIFPKNNQNYSSLLESFDKYILLDIFLIKSN